MVARKAPIELRRPATVRASTDHDSRRGWIFRAFPGRSHRRVLWHRLLPLYGL